MAYSGGGSGPGSPCGACKFLRRKCEAECMFAPYFCAEDGVAQFAAIHKVFGAMSDRVVTLQMEVAQAKTQVSQTLATTGAPLMGNPILQQAWQMEHESMSTQSSGCYSLPRPDGSSLQEMYCFSEQKEGSY